MLKATALVAASLVLGVSAAAIADTPQQLAQAQMQNRSQIEQDYQARLRAARTPEERARIQAEYDQQMQQSAVPDDGATSLPGAPDAAGSATPLPAPRAPDALPEGGRARGERIERD